MKIRTWVREHRLAWGLFLVVAFCLLRAIQTWMWRQGFGSLDFQDNLAFGLFLFLWLGLISVGLIGGGVIWLPQTSWRELGWVRKGLPKAIGMGFVGFVLMTINVIIWGMIEGATGQPQLLPPSPVRLLLVAVFAFGLPAWVEENLFRGYLQPLLIARTNLWLAIVAQAALFSLAHIGYTQNPFDFGSAFVAGLILGWLRKREGSLIAPFLAHGLFWFMGAFMHSPV
jgi:membrane protease YdiL (CAAX protease family)